ncbi:conserved hypothetical protein [Vibrio phage 141O35-1]|nr:conserved hypothetical protein [Vibrio phage 141O35-1]CAH9016218.1 conserved hypothetical protein [Vibrio phage 141E35-1]
MELKKFLHVLRQKDGITVQFSHLGYVVVRNGEILDQRGDHAPVQPRNRTERVRKVGNMYCAIASSCRYMSSDLRALVGDLLACMANTGERR